MRSGDSGDFLIRAACAVVYLVVGSIVLVLKSFAEAIFGRND
jgi:hypothetical protein